MSFQHTIFFLEIYYVNSLSTCSDAIWIEGKWNKSFGRKTKKTNSLETEKSSDFFSWDCHMFQNQLFFLVGCTSDYHCLNTCNLLNYPLGSSHNMFSDQALFKQNCYTCVNKTRFSYKILCFKVALTVTERKKKT